MGWKAASLRGGKMYWDSLIGNLVIFADNKMESMKEMRSKATRTYFFGRRLVLLPLNRTVLIFMREPLLPLSQVTTLWSNLFVQPGMNIYGRTTIL